MAFGLQVFLKSSALREYTNLDLSLKTKGKRINSSVFYIEQLTQLDKNLVITYATPIQRYLQMSNKDFGILGSWFFGARAFRSNMFRIEPKKNVE